jgi:hypothetical protein
VEHDLHNTEPGLHLRLFALASSGRKRETEGEKVDSFGGGKDQDASQLAVVASLPLPLGLFSEARSPEACKAWPLDA